MVTPGERHSLRISYAVAFLVGATGVAFGLSLRSQVVLFNGYCLMVHGAMTAIAAAVSRLISQAGSGRFQYRYWHLESVIAASTGMVFSLIGAFAFVEAIYAFITSKQKFDFAFGAYYALTASIVSLVMCLFTRRRAQEIDSELLRIAQYAWLLSGVFGVVISVSLLSVSVLSGSVFPTWQAYVDSMILAFVGVILAILPVQSVVQAVRDITRTTPTDIDAEVCRVMDSIIAQYDLLTYSCHVAKAGRARFIEIHIVTQPDFAQGGVAEIDRVRENIEEHLEMPGQPRWLTITFTTCLKRI